MMNWIKFHDTVYHILMRKDNFGITPILLYFNDTLMPDFQKSLCIKIDIEIHNKNGVSNLEEPISLIITVDMT